MQLELRNIHKSYSNGDKIEALRGIDLVFRESEFVAVLGPSGCGKTTLLNIIGGLDRYDSGELVINGVATSRFRDADWDAYRNRSIGFVFQNYNLISHQTVLENVEIALTLSGIPSTERKARAEAALASVGLADQLHKKPNQLSGGQMQRVAIARALVNDPDVILADEPTGALDSKTSLQLMELLSEIAQTRLVIMVTHNQELADAFATRVIRLLDGAVVADSGAGGAGGRASASGASEGGAAGGAGAGGRASAGGASAGVAVATAPAGIRQTSMAMTTALGLSLKNLLSKRGRTFTTAIAGSIGIIGVALVLALSGGLSGYMDTLQRDTLSGFPITVNATEQSFDMDSRNPFADALGNTSYVEFPEGGTIYSYDSSLNRVTHQNLLSDEYLAYVSELPTALPGTVNTITFQYAVDMNLLVETADGVVLFNPGAQRGGDNPFEAMTGGSVWQQAPDDPEFIMAMYDLVGADSRLPETADELALVVDEYNRLPASFMSMLGMDGDEYSIDDFIGRELVKVVANDDYYALDGEVYSVAGSSQYQELFDKATGLSLTVVGVLRIKPDAATSFFSPGLIYTTALTEYVLEQANGSAIAEAQLASGRDVLTGLGFADDRARQGRLAGLGADMTPTGISIYPVDYAAKDSIKTYLDAYNIGLDLDEQVVYSDMAEMVASMTSTLLNTVSLVLVGFAAISLVVSTIMIGIITYVSVIERTREIGILRSVGARKRDISRVFMAETLIIGCAAGALGVVLAYLLALPINAVVGNLTGLTGIAALNPLLALLLVAGSMALTLVAGLFPSRTAARKDPVEALRTE